jgi:hypothetical protein
MPKLGSELLAGPEEEVTPKQEVARWRQDIKVFDRYTAYMTDDELSASSFTIEGPDAKTAYEGIMRGLRALAVIEAGGSEQKKEQALDKMLQSIQYSQVQREE